MFDKLFGVTKNTFLEKNVVRASDHDKFNDNKCMFCWGSYDEDHRAVRAQPCNHVFGRDCLEEMINAQNGDQCPICRTVWFQPPFKVSLGRLLLDNLMRLQIWILFATYRLRAFGYRLKPFWYRLPALIMFPLKAINSWFYMSNPYYQIDFILQHLTNIYPRNQILELQMYVAMRIFPVVQAAYLHVMISSGLSIALAVKTDAFYLVSELCQLPWQWQTLKVLLLWIILLSAPMTTVNDLILGYTGSFVLCSDHNSFSTWRNRL